MNCQTKIDLDQSKQNSQNKIFKFKKQFKLQRNTTNQVYKLKLANQQRIILRMIKQRNHNKIKQAINNKPKINKKLNKANKQQVQTDVEQCQDIIVILPPKCIAPDKPKKSIPKFFLQLDPKDQVEQYQAQIIRYLRQQQQKYKIDENYLKFHKTLNIKVRNFLVKYIFKIVQKYRCKRSTLYLAVYTMDFYLSKSPNFTDNMESVAIAQASLHIAMKFQQIYPPQLKQWANDTEQIKKILVLEAQILRTLDFKLNLPSIYYFQQYFQKKFCQSQQYKQNKQNIFLQQLKINLISDLCLFDVSLYEYQPYDLARSIRKLVYGAEPSFKQQRLALNIKWGLERNKIHLDWLRQTKYKGLNHN